MPSKYQIIVSMAASEAQSIVSNAERYTSFLTTAANNYKYSFQEQLLIHAQKPDATACAEIEVWNKLGRWVNKGTKGIALLVDRDVPYRLRYVFDVSDTNSRAGREISLWKMEERFEGAVIESLENSFGDIVSKHDFQTALMEAAFLVVTDNLPDYLADLKLVKQDSWLEELDDLNTEVWLKTTLQNSVAYMLMVRCGYDPRVYLSLEDFAHVVDFNTPETVSILGAATSDISEMILREIGETVKGLRRAEKENLRTFESAAGHEYHDGRNQTQERRNDDGTDLYNAGRLSDPESGSPGGTEDWQVWNAAAQLPPQSQERPVHRDAPVEQAEPAPGGDRPAGLGDDGASDLSDGENPGSDGAPERDQSDGLGAGDEQHPQFSGGSRDEGTDLQLSDRNGKYTWDVDFYHHDDEKNELIRTCDALKEHRVEIAAFFADHPDREERGNFVRSFFNNIFIEQILSNGERAGYRAYSDIFHLWRGSYLNRTHEVYMRWSHVASHIEGMILLHRWLAPGEKLLPSVDEQMSMIDMAEQEKSSAFVLPQEAIDYVLCGGSNISQSKLRIYEQFQQGLTPKENIDFLKNEYGWGGHSDAIPGSGYWEEHDGKGIMISRGGTDARSTENSYLIRWPAAEKRIRELIKADRYLTPAEKREYPNYQRNKALRAERAKIAEEFRSVAYDYNDFQTQLGNQDARLNMYVLSNCASEFAAGSKTTYTLSKDNFILPLMREALHTIIGENTHLTERCEALLVQLDSDLAKPMEPTYDELNPPPPPKMEYRFSLGDTVYIGTQEYELISIDDENVRLFDPEFPLFNKEMTRAEFDEKIAENPRNDHLRHIVEEPTAVAETPPDAPAPEPTADETLPIGRIEYLHTDGRVREQIEYTDIAQMEKDLREDNFNGVPMKVTMYVDRQGKTVPHRFVYEMDPPLHGTSVIMNPHIQGGLETPMEQAMRLINEFCQSEYESEADFSDMRNIGIGYTTITDAEIPVQINVNLVEFRLDRYVEGVIVDQRQYDSLEALIKNELDWLDFDSLMDFSDEELAKVSIHQRDTQSVATYYSDDERIEIKKYPNGFFYNHYGYNPQTDTAYSVAGPFDTLEEAEETLKSHRPQAEKEIDPAQPQTFIDHFYVVEDLAVQGALSIEEYDTLADALDAYFALPADKMRALGAMNTNDLPGSLDLVQCKAGVDTLIEDYLKVEGWQNEEVLTAVQEITAALEARKIQLAPPTPKPKGKATSTVLLPSVPDAERSNFRITDDEIGVGTPSQRYANNVAAIRLLKKLEAEERLATPEEQEILSQYVGWGGLSHWFDDRHPKYQELKELLTEDEYSAARESTLTAFYTPPVVIRAIYQALENMQFRNGNILEPSCGIGNFMGMIPESMSGSKIYGVEIDSISGRIAQQLYQKSSIAVQGFEKTDLPDSFFDAAIGNVPFGQFKVPDKRYDRHNFLIHDYFFARTLDKVRPGGIIAFVTSKGTMDKENPAVRKYIAQRADLLGAIRLPNDTFKSAAGTEVTSDIIFLQKRDRLIDREPDWVHLGVAENGLRMNQYFIDNPDMIMGEMKEVSGPFGPETACIPYEGQDLGDLLHDAIQSIHAEFMELDMEELTDEEDLSIPADPSVRNFSYALVDGVIYYRENSRMNPVDVSMTAENRIKGMIGIRDCVRTLIEYQTEDYPDSMIQAEQVRLNELYDAFNEKYGRINSRANGSAFNADSSYCLLSSLEITDDEGNFVRKADMFSKRTIKQKVIVTSVDTASEALALSLAEKARIDMPYMMELTGKTEEQICDDLQGVIFLNPDYVVESQTRVKYLPADEYLSGNVREKLAQVKPLAQLHPADFSSHVQALEAVQPVDLTASEISVRLGATWLPTDVVEDFMFTLFSTPRYSQWGIHVHYSQYTGEWNIEGKSHDRGNVKASNAYGTNRINGYKIIEETLNLRDVRIFDYEEDANGRRVPVLNKKETAIAQGKQELIKQAFADWIWQDPARRERLCRLYNEKFNSVRPREYDGSHLTFVGMNPEITLRPHQVNAIAHILYGGNTLLAHVVGAGKTFEMVAAAMESKRLGLCQKSLFVVPNHLTEQWAAEFLQLYPSANILVATRKDFETKNRKKFCGRIATGDYDAIIIGHSQFEKIPMSLDRQRIILEQQMQEIKDGIAELKRNRGDSFSVKQLEKSKKSVKQKLEKLNDQSRKDDLVTFEELGVDRIFIDEAHYYKNLAAFSKMRNVGGISQTEAMKSSDLYMKCRYLDELTGGRGVVFATGTPISNSMVELYTMQKYLQYGTLRRNNLLHFDAWASTFGETVTAIELAPEGSGYRAKTRFARFYNLPELMAMFKETADIQTADMLKLPVPEAHYHHVVLKPSEHQKEMVTSLSERAERVRNKMVDSSTDNMLLITNDGRKLALDQRLMNEALPDSETSKVAACAANVFDIWQRTMERRSTQMVFCDLSTPHNDGKFNVYDDLRAKLITMGIPAEEIAYIHSAGTETQKKELFGKVRSGQIRVLLGSTQKMGAGTNVQHRLIALHHLDCPWRPSDLQQREGRIIRQGNENPEVDIFTYVTENTFDSYLYQLVESKQRFIGQIMTSKSPVRSAEDIDETALSYAEIKALCTGNPYIKEKMDLDIAVQRLKLLKASHLSQRYALEDQIIKEFPQKIAAFEQRIEGYTADMSHLKEHTTHNEDGFSPMEVEGVLYTDKKAAGSAVLAACHAMTSPDAVPLGKYRGFDMSLHFDSMSREYKITLKGTLHHTVALGTDIFGNILRLDNCLEGMEERLISCREQLENVRVQLTNAQVEVERPFPQEEELRTKSARLDELNILLNMDKPENEILDGDISEDEPEPKGRSTKDRER